MRKRNATCLLRISSKKRIHLLHRFPVRIRNLCQCFVLKQINSSSEKWGITHEHNVIVLAVFSKLLLLQTKMTFGLKDLNR